MSPHDVHRIFGGQLRARSAIPIHPAITVVRLRGHFWSRLFRKLFGA